MNRLGTLFVISFACCSSWATVHALRPPPAPDQALSVCAITANAKHYDGMSVVLQGYYRMVIHGAILRGNSCPEVELAVRRARNYRANKQASNVLRSLTKKSQFRPVDVIVRGVFRVAKEGHCFGQICSSYQIEIRELLYAQPVPR